MVNGVSEVICLKRLSAPVVGLGLIQKTSWQIMLLKCMNLTARYAAQN
jgi:hypothetical protein